MRKLYSIVLLVLLFGACKNNNQQTAASTDLNSQLLNKILGSFTGNFGDNMITVLITKVDKGLIEGRTVVAGNERPFTGTVEEKDGVFSILAKEPGDDKNDGTFEFTIGASAPDVLTGSWHPFDQEKNSKEYKLMRRELRKEFMGKV